MTTTKGASAPDFVAELNNIAESAGRDPESAHCEADEVLVRFIRYLGHDDVADAWEAVEPKWYA